MMKSEIIILAGEKCSLAQIERRLLSECFPGIVAVNLSAAETNRRQGVLGNVKWQIAKRGCAAKITKLMKDDTTPLLAYGGSNEAEIASAAAKREGVVIVRNRLHTPPAIHPLPKAERHCVADHALTFISASAPELTSRFMSDVAKARTGSAIEWLTLTDYTSGNMPTPPNLTIRKVDSLEEAVAAGPVDWYVDLDPDPELQRHGALLFLAMAAGVPFAATESERIADAAMEECGITFAPNPSKEEFIRGLLPYIDSDFRSEAMRLAAHDYWKKNFVAKRNIAALAEEINMIIQKP